MRFVLFQFVLWPLIKRDYALRAKGLRPDRWHWADLLAIRLGMMRWYPEDEL